MPLTQSLVVNVQPREKTYRLFDGLGLYLEVTPQGGKLWRIKYYIAGRDQRLSLGTFPVVSLKHARLRYLAIRRQLESGLNPAELRREAKRKLTRKEETLEAIAREWHQHLAAKWTDSHRDRILSRLESHVFPWLGKLPVAHLRAVDILDCVRRLEHQRTHSTARRVLQTTGQVGSLARRLASTSKRSATTSAAD